jgi:hypothetical protein
MTPGIDKEWTVLESYETDEEDYSVDIFERPDGTFGFEQYRKDPEDMGAWTDISYFSDRSFATQTDALDAARHAVHWLGDTL